MLLDQVFESTRAGYHDIGAGLQVANLAGIPHATVNRGGAHAIDLRQRRQHVIDLIGELAGGGEYQAAWSRHEILGTTFLGMALLHAFDLMTELAHVLVFVGIHLPKAGDHRNGERQGLAGAGTATAKHIATGQGIRQSIRLDRERGLLVIRRKHAYERARNAQLGEGQRTLLFLAIFGHIVREGIFFKNGIGHSGLSCQTFAHVAQTC